jgi:16S rRNA (guanine966-N2)-methyltransferase
MIGCIYSSIAIVNRKISMRVIAGKYKGRRLRGPCGMDLRPTGDRLKETLFNILGPSVAGAVMLDVFGGTGAIGIEALSRGAGNVVFIENSAEGQRLIRQNLELCGISQGYRLVSQDVFPAMRALAREGFKADIAFFDPPYHWKPYRDLLEIAFQQELLFRDSRLVIEHHRKALLPESGDGYARSRIVRQGDHWLSFYMQNEPGARSQESRAG